MTNIDPLVRHQAVVEGVIADGQPSAIKHLYVDLGDDFWKSHGDDLDGVPVLSLPETLPVVVARLDGARGRVLDAGCGPNPAAAIVLAAHPGRTMVLLDIGWGTVRLAQEVARHQGAEMPGVVGDVEALPFRRDAFGALVCDDTIEHLPDDRAGVAELARVVRPGGQLVLATPNRHNLFVLRARLADRLRGRRLPASHYFRATSHVREYAWPEFERLVGSVARLRARAPVGWTGGWKTGLASRATAVRPFHRLSQMIVLDAEPLPVLDQPAQGRA